LEKIKRILGFDMTSEDSMAFVKKGVNKKMIWKKFSNACPNAKNATPFTYFMAGAPGSGKTEMIKNYLAEIFVDCMVADADEIRKLLPYYNGNNAHKVQRAASKGVDILYDGALKNKCNILVDGTFSLPYEKCRENVARSLKKGRGVAIFYLYTHPRVAWTYAKKREYTDGRKTKANFFLKAFYKSRENVDRIKKEFGKDVYVVGIKSNYGYLKGIGEIKVNINNVLHGNDNVWLAGSRNVRFKEL
jgi:predicted ABC-type ATPase